MFATKISKDYCKVNSSQTAQSGRLVSKLGVPNTPVNVNKLNSAVITPGLIARGASQTRHGVEENREVQRDQGQVTGTQKGERGDADHFSETILVHVMGSAVDFPGCRSGQAALLAGVQCLSASVTEWLLELQVQKRSLRLLAQEQFLTSDSQLRLVEKVALPMKRESWRCLSLHLDR